MNIQNVRISVIIQIILVFVDGRLLWNAPGLPLHPVSRWSAGGGISRLDTGTFGICGFCSAAAPYFQFPPLLSFCPLPGSSSLRV